MAYTYKQLSTAYAAVHGGIEPTGEIASQLLLMTNASFTDQQRLAFILDSADSSTAVAVLSYQFFTGKSPTAQGLTYLINSSGNGADLNDPYYARFNLENRYMNFAANLALGGEAASAFLGQYGAMSYADYVASIYETIIGSTYAKAAGLDPVATIAAIIARQDLILTSAQSAGMITATSTQAQIDLALKVATAAYLLAEGAKADVGAYAGAANNFMLALATGQATYNTDITKTYAPVAGSGSAGTGHAVDTPLPTETVVGYEPPPKPPEPEPEPEPAPVSHIFTLTTGADAFTGEGADDTFNATLGTTATLNAGDKLDGAGGEDTLSIISSGTLSFAMSSATITNIERLKAKSNGGTLTLDMTAATAFTAVTNDGSIGNVTFQNLEAITKMAVADTTNSVTTFNYATAVLAGNADVGELALSNAKGGAIFISTGTSTTNAFETLNIISNGASNAPTLSTNGGSARPTTINISGAAPLTLTFSSSEQIRSAATFDASAATGNITLGAATTALGLTGGQVNQTVKLGSGDDLVFFGGSLTSGDTVDGGAGYDVLGMTLAITDATVLSNVTNVEAIRFDVSGSTFNQDASLLAGHGLVELQLNRTGGPAFIPNFRNLESGAKVTLLTSMSSANLTLSLLNMGPGSSDTLTLNFANGNITLGILNNVSGLETLNIISGGSSGTNAISADNVAAKQVITGARPLNLTGAAAASLNVDASAFTQKLTISAAGGSSQNDTVVLGTGDDVVNMRAGTDTIYVGPTTDTSHAYRGADAITASSTTTIVFTDNTETVGGGGSTSYAGVLAVTNASGVTLKFSAGDDHFSVQNAAGVSAHGLARDAVAQGLSAGDTMFRHPISSNTVTTALSNTSLIELTTPTAFNTDIKTTFAAAMGSGSISGLAADAAYLVSMFDSASSKMLLAIVNTGASTAGDTTLSAADFTDTGIVLIGTFAMASQIFSLGAAI